jgi:cytochrome c
MKKFLSFIFLVLLISCKSKEPENKEDFHYEESKTPTQLGQEIFEGKGNCFACHNPQQKTVGPAIMEIATIYKTKKGSIVKFLKEQADPIVDPDKYETMRTNFPVTKAMSDEELKGIEAYILSQAR